MPTYDYECKTCGHTFEAFQGIHDDPLTKCPKCGKAIKRLIGAGIGIIFKGNGFYSTDNRTKPVNTVPDGEKPSKENKKSETAPSSDKKSSAGKEKKSDGVKESSSKKAG